MSEFSESYHFLARPDAVLALAKSLRKRSVMLPEGDRWTCLAIATTEKPAAVAKRWSGLLVHYAHAPDHECRLRLFDGGALRGEIRILFEGQEPKPLDPKPWRTRELLDDAALAKIARWVRHGDPGTRGDRVGYAIAAMLGFEQYRWLGVRDVEDEERRAELLARASGATSIGENGQIEERPEDVAAAGAPARIGASAGSTLIELLVSEGMVDLSEPDLAPELDAGARTVMARVSGAAKKAEALARWLPKQPAVAKFRGDLALLEGILEAW